MRESWERRTEVLALSAAEATALLQPAFPGARAVDVRAADGGKANTNLCITLADGGRCLLRLFVRDPASGAKEATILRRLTGIVPVPALHHFATGNPVTGHPYAMLEWIEGPRLEQVLARSDAAAAASLAHDAGRTLAAVGTLTFPRSGFLAADLSIAEPLETGAAGFLGFVEEMAAAPPAATRLGPDLQQRLLAFCRANVGRLDGLDPQARLVHCDFDPSNILLRPTPEGWEVAAVIDWEFAVAATPLIDLGHLLRAPHGDLPDFAEALAAGYRAGGGGLPDDWPAAARLLDLLAWLDFLGRPGDQPNLFEASRRAIEKTLSR